MKIDLPPNYSLATWRRGFTFTWREGQGWRQATEEMGAPYPTPEAASEAAMAHAQRAEFAVYADNRRAPPI